MAVLKPVRVRKRRGNSFGVAPIVLILLARTEQQFLRTILAEMAIALPSQ
ncbi:hypothetical protein [Mycolicibacter hiberniae]|nr:hypothetical protein [Mycolicibacter hiberniae]MCV7086971.1 hypothetical protein [Mycolicibacter hiberniae]